MKILVVNDDGYRSPLLLKLAKALTKYGLVTVVAPDRERSCSSQSGSFFKELTYQSVHKIKGVAYYKLNGFPVDCVWKTLTKENFDLVVSGINNGLNVGNDIAYSGTVGAALEAALYHTKSIALSVPHDEFAYVDTYLEPLLDYLMSLDSYRILNVNLPGEDTLGHLKYVFTAVANSDIRREEVTRFKSKYLTDIEAVREGMVSITYLTNDKTDYEALEK